MRCFMSEFWLGVELSNAFLSHIVHREHISGYNLVSENYVLSVHYVAQKAKLIRFYSFI